MRKPAFVPPYKYDGESKAKYAEREEELRKLHDLLKPGDKITMVLRHRSASGMYRTIDFFLLTCAKGEVERRWLSYWMAHAGIGRWDEKHGALGMSGAGMDMGFHAVYELSSMLYPGGFDCTGKGCPANDHSNRWSAATNGRCFICGTDLPDFEQVDIEGFHGGRKPQTSSPFTRDGLPVWPEKCVTTKQHHRDGGYALRHEWLG